MQNILLLEDHATTARWLETIANSSFPEAAVLHVGMLTSILFILSNHTTV